MLRLIQHGTGSRRPLVVLWLVGPQMDAAIREAIGPRAAIVADVAAPQQVDLGTITAYVRHNTGAEVGAIALGGWSLGCSRVRSLLASGVLPVAVVCADGTTNTLPPDPAKAAVWRDLAERARAESCVFAVSHTYMTYVERLRSPEVPFQATVNTMRAATKLPLIEPTGDEPAEVHEGGLHCYSYRSADIDERAHIRQLREALPMMLREHVAPLFADVVQGSDDEPVPSTLPATQVPRSLQMGCRGADVAELQRLLNTAGSPLVLTVDGSFGPRTRAAVAQAQANGGVEVTGIADAQFIAALREGEPAQPMTLAGATLAEAIADLNAGIRETSHNDGPEIRRLYLAPLGLPAGSDWCAAGVTSWMRRAAEALRVPMPVHGSAGAKSLMVQFQAAGRFIGRDKLTEADVTAGVVVFWDRSIPGRPDTSWHGHAGIVRDHAVGGTFGTVEANSGANGDEVAHMVRKMSDPRLLGIGRLD